MLGTNVLSCLPTSSGMSLCHCLLLQLAISSYDHGQKQQTIITYMCSLPCCANEEPIKLLTWLWLCHMPVFCNISPFLHNGKLLMLPDCFYTHACTHSATHMHTKYNCLPPAHFEQCLQVHLAEVHPGDLPPIHIDLSLETHCLSS